VFIAQREFSVDSHGHNMLPALMECLRLLAKEDKRWKYVALLQNHDSLIKTNREVVQVMEWLDGANDVEVAKLPNGRVDLKQDWSFSALRLFRNGRSPPLTLYPWL